jgi:hypothetical protein
MADAERRLYGRSIARLAADDAELLMLAFSQRRRRPGPHGAAQQEIARSLGGGWDMLWSGRDKEIARIHLVGPVEASWYRFRRRGGMQ